MKNLSLYERPRVEPGATLFSNWSVRFMKDPGSNPGRQYFPDGVTVLL